MSTPPPLGPPSGGPREPPANPAARLPSLDAKAPPAPTAATGHDMSVGRPMSAEERAELEEVYRERGCGVECDC